jgi:hypothetical protein
MAKQVGEMLCVSPGTGKKLGIWAVSLGGAIGLGTQDGSEFWILETILHESTEIQVKSLTMRDHWESTVEQLARVKKTWDADSRIFAGALQLLKEAGLTPNSTALIAAAERSELSSDNYQDEAAAGGGSKSNLKAGSPSPP